MNGLQPALKEDAYGVELIPSRHGAVIVRDEDEEIKGGFSFIREATESEVADKQKRREIKKGADYQRVRSITLSSPSTHTLAKSTGFYTLSAG
jgi:predicted ribosome quality control (RQC) complex YloA/Tae2 family protein